MQPQQRHDPVLPATDENRVANKQPSMPKAVFSKVKQKASKIKEKVKKAGHTGDGTRNVLMNNSITDDHGQQKTRPLFKSAVGRDEATNGINSSSDDESMGKVNSQFKYEQLASPDILDGVQGDGSDVEHHDGVPTVPAHVLGGTYWSRSDSRSPAGDDKDSGDLDPLQTSPPKYHNKASFDKNDNVTEGYIAGKPFTEKRSEGIQQYEEVPDVDSSPHDHIKRFSEDLSMDRKLGIGQDDTNTGHNEDREHGTSERSVNRFHPTRNPPPSPINGADEQMYKPVPESDNFTSSFTSESINAHLYGDVLPTENRFSTKDRGSDYHSNKDGNEFSFGTENMEAGESQQCSKASDNVPPDSKIGQDTTSANRNVDGVESNDEGWGKWSEDKLNQADDVSASKPGAADTKNEMPPTANSRRQKIGKTMSTDYFDPSVTDDHAFEEQMMLGTEDVGEEGTFMDTAMAGSAVIADTINKLKDTVASTLGYGSVAEESNDERKDDEDNEHNGAVGNINKEVPSHASSDADDRHEARESEKPDDFHFLVDETEGASEKGKAENQNGSLERMEEKQEIAENISKTIPLSDSKANAQKTVKPEITHHPAGINSSSGIGNAGGNISHQWSLDSASDVPQAAFL